MPNHDQAPGINISSTWRYAVFCFNLILHGMGNGFYETKTLKELFNTTTYKFAMISIAYIGKS